MAVTLTRNRTLVAYQGLPLASTLQSSPTQTWTTGGNALWTGTTDVMAPAGGLGTARATALGNEGEEAWLQTTVNAPGILGFNWRLDIASPATPFSGIANLEVQVNGVTLGGRYMASPFSAAAFHIPGSGPVTVRFRLQRTQNYPRTPVGGQETAYLANFYFGPLTPPTLLPATDATKTSLVLNWTAPVGADGYQLEFASNDSFTADVRTFSLDRQVTQKTIEGLNAGTSYFYRVAAHGIDGSTAVSTVGTTSTAAKKDQTITFGPISDKQPNYPPFALSATTTAHGLTVAFTISGPAYLSGRTVLLTGAEGVVTITASQPGDANYAAATPVSRSFSVIGAAQEITFNSLADKPSTAAPFDLSATATSGLPVQFAVAGPATLGANGKTLVPTGEPGVVTVTATQPGGHRFSTVYTAAKPVINTFNIISVPPTFAQKVEFTPPLSKTYGDPVFTLTATASSNLPVSFSLISGPATLAGAELSITGAGKIVVTATQPGNGRFKPAATTRTIVINKAQLRVNTADASRLVRVANPPFTLSYTGFIGTDQSSGIDTPPIATTTAHSSSPVGEYTISFKGGLDNNYRFAIGELGSLAVLGFSGAYEALLVNDAGVPLGKLELSVPNNALTYTGTLHLASEPSGISIFGSLSASDGASATGAWSRTANPAKGITALSLGFELAGDVLDGELSGGNNLALSIGSGSRVFVQALDAKNKKLPAPWTGAHTLVLRDPAALDPAPFASLPAPGAVPLPLGSGHASVTVAASGVMTVKGKLADGTALTATARAATVPGDTEMPAGHYRVFARPNGTRLDSFFSGPLVLGAHPDQTRFAGRFHVAEEDGLLFWAKAPLPPATKPANRDKSYRQGFAADVVAILDPWIAPTTKAATINGATIPAGNLAQRLGLTSSPTTAVDLSIAYGPEGIDLGDRANQLPVRLGLSVKNTFSVAAPVTNPVNVTKFAVSSFSASTGAFTGSFLLRDPAPTATKPAATKDRKVIFSGTLRQGPGGAADVLGLAHFLFDPSVTDASDEQISGELLLSAPPPAP